MRNLSYLNDLYNVQDVVLLMVMIENRFQEMLNEAGYNPRKINSASKLSSCIQREQSKCILALPTNNCHVEIFEKTLSGGFSCVNTRLSFDTELLMPNLIKKDFNKMDIDQSLKGFKRNDLKLVYKVKFDDQKKHEKKRVVTKILKLDGNNQYGYSMTEPLPTGYIKENKNFSWVDFNILIESVDLTDKIGHLFVVDIFFDAKNANKKQLLYNEVFPPVIEKQKILEMYERSAYQLLELFDKTKEKPKSYRCTPKSHANLFPKTFIPLYLEDLRFLIKRCGWKVTKIYSHFTFEQSCFKREFVLTNQRKRQEAKSSIEKDFYKLMNNANFGNDCRDNRNITKFQPIVDEIEEIIYIKKYYNLFDNNVSKFVNSDILEKQINQEFEQNLSTIKFDDPFRAVKIQSLESVKMNN